jgi:hypothetical protein
LKIEWEPKDVTENVGRVVTSGDHDEHWIISYEPSLDRNQARYRLTSLRDGMLTDAQTAANLAAQLTAAQRFVLARKILSEDLVKGSLK